MTKFFYKAKDWNGKAIKGVLDSQDKKSALESIKSGGLIPLAIMAESTSVFNDIYKRLFSKISLKQISNFTRQLSTMMNSGLALTDALALLKNQTDKKSLMFEILDYTLTTVQGGHSLADGLGKYKKNFGEAYIASIEAGEEGGVLEEVLTKLADNLEKQNDFASKVKGAMIYPIIVIVGMIAVVIIMMIFVIPKLMGLYSDFGAKMPASTQLLMDISGFMTKFWFLIPIIVVGVFAFFKIGGQNADFRLKRDVLKLKIPIIGVLNQKTILSTTIRTMSMLLSAGIPLVEALKIVSSVAANELFRGAYLKISERVQKGFSIANSFEETGVFPVIVNQMVATGEATGKLDTVLLKVSDYFSAEAEQSVKSLTSAIEPIIMILLGLGVAFLVVAVLMPIYNLTSSM
ncbi:MAG TPA: type II secretion system F family protein [Candidatus Woesebacteria bacterium]|nr:type II secretion system F family protein [Candidatus Woesebacteria bacterium]